MSKILDLLGLGQVKLSATAIAGIVMVTLMLALAGFAAYEMHQVNALHSQLGQDATQIKQLSDANKDLSDQLKVASASSHVDNQVATTDCSQKQQAQTTTSTISTNAQNQINAIVQKYQPQGPAQAVPASSAQAEEKEISGVQINSMWQTYCAAVPASTAGCAAVTAPAKLSKPVIVSPAQAGPVA